MDDLISRKELLESIEKVSVKGNVLDDDWVYRFVQEFPSIDAVQVVRCKDCENWDTSWKPTRATGEEHWCSAHDIYMRPNDYCSMAERKKKE